MPSPSLQPAPAEPPQSAELFDFLLEHIPDLIFFKDRQSRFIRVNHALLGIFGLDQPQEVVGKTDFDFLLAADAQRTFEDEQRVLAGEPILDSISRKEHADGTPWWALTTKLPLRNAAGEIIGTCGISRDITRLKETEEALSRANAQLEHTLEKLQAAQEQLIASEKAQSIARMAAGVAHEVRNPLNIVNTGIEFLSGMTAITADDTAPLVLEEMRVAIGRADIVISTLMDASRPAGLTLENTEVNAFIAGVLDTLGSTQRTRGVEITTDFQEVPSVMIDRQKMRQVLEGLCINAMEAIPDGGQVHVWTRLEKLDAETASRQPGSRDGHAFRAGEEVVRIDIEDTGGGIPAEALHRIFDPFFSTKETGAKRGLGLGLTLCRAIVELHKGSLQIANREDAQGTRATLRLKGKAVLGG